MASTQDGTFIAVHEPLVTKVNEENNNINPDDESSTIEEEEEFSTESYRIEDLFAENSWKVNKQLAYKKKSVAYRKKVEFFSKYYVEEDEEVTENTFFP